MTARDDFEQYGFSPAVSEILAKHIHDPFPDYEVIAEETIGKGGALTRSQLVTIDWLYRSHNIGREREIWEGLKRTPERVKAAKRPAVRRETVRIFGHPVTILRDLKTGRFVRRKRRG